MFGNDGLKTVFRGLIPVGAIEFEKDRGVRKGHSRLQNEYAKFLADLVQFRDELFVG